MRTCGVTLPVHTGHVHGNTHMLSHTGLPTTQAVSPRAFVPHLSLLSLPYRAAVRSKTQSGAAGRPEVPAPRTTLGLFWQRRATGGPSTSPGLSRGQSLPVRGRGVRGLGREVAMQNWRPALRAGRAAGGRTRLSSRDYSSPPASKMSAAPPSHIDVGCLILCGL